MKILPHIAEIPQEKLASFIKEKATTIVRVTQARKDWDDPEQILKPAIDLAHACFRLVGEIEATGVKIN